MKRFIVLFFLTSILGTEAQAQMNMGALQDHRNAANAARHLPTFLGDGSKKAQIAVFNLYASVGSNFATVEDALAYIRSDQITGDMIATTIDKLHPDGNKAIASAEIALINVAYNLTKKNGDQILSIGFGVNERVESHLTFNEELFRLAYYGNKQYAGQTINLMPRFNGLAFTDYYVAAAFNIATASGIGIKPAIRLSYLSGQASVEMAKDNSITLYTEKDGRYLDFEFNYTVNTSMDGDSLTLAGSTFNVNDKSFQSGAGSGFGADLGCRISLSHDLSFNIGLMDLGSIRFKKGVTNMSNHSGYRYEGEELSFAQDQSIDLDSLAGLAKPTYTHEAYNVRLPTKLLLTGSKSFGRVEAKSEVYYKHQLTAMYVQGFANYLSSTTTPYLAVGYTYSLNNVLNIGANAGVGGISGGTFGVLASVKAGAFCLGFNSNNIIPLIAPASGRYADFGMLLGFSF